MIHTAIRTTMAPEKAGEELEVCEHLSEACDALKSDKFSCESRFSEAMHLKSINFDAESCAAGQHSH